MSTSTFVQMLFQKESAVSVKRTEGTDFVTLSIHDKDGNDFELEMEIDFAYHVGKTLQANMKTIHEEAHVAPNASYCYFNQ